ncbi:MAG TPA: hypothetical protein VMX74_06875 [Pirellulales bacterium]|nr:hypothetical protein [Pirellulales bacterium]
MAGEIKSSPSITLTNGSLYHRVGPVNQTIAQNGTGVFAQSGILNTTGITVGDLAAMVKPGVFIFSHIGTPDSANIRVAVVNNMNVFGLVKPGETFVFRTFPTAVIRFFAEAGIQPHYQLTVFED